MSPMVIFKCGVVDIIEDDIADDQGPTTVIDESLTLRKEIIRLESLVRSQVQHQWQVSMENYRCP